MLKVVPEPVLNRAKAVNNRCDGPPVGIMFIPLMKPDAFMFYKKSIISGVIMDVNNLKVVHKVLKTGMKIVQLKL